MRQNKTHRIYTKVTEQDFAMLDAVCKAYGFRSMYQLLRTLLVLFLRSLKKSYKDDYEDGIAKEITDIFDELADYQTARPDHKCNPGSRRNNDD